MRALLCISLLLSLEVAGSSIPTDRVATANGAYIAYVGKNCYNGHGAVEIDSDSTAPARLTVASCEARCDANDACDCVTLRPSDGKCWMRATCQPSLCSGGHFDTYQKASSPDPFKWISDIAAGSGGRFQLERKTYYIDKQYQLPSNTEIRGAGSGPEGTVIKAMGSLYDGICGGNAKNRKGFVLGDNTYIGQLHFVGMETKRFSDNQLLCGGAPFETPGCAGTGQFEDSPVSCGGDIGLGRGITNATVDDVTVESMTVQNVFYMPPTKAGVPASKDITVSKLVCNGTWADGMNIHGAHSNVLVRECEIRHTGDDTYAIWSVGLPGADNITFISNVAENPWFRKGGSSAASGYPNTDNCFAAYGGKTSAFLNNTCTGGHDAIVIFGNDMHKTYGGSFSSESATKVQGNRGMDKQCYFGVHFPGQSICEENAGTEIPLFHV
eukprot:TRINITY_DN50292_c0_g1_i1.p1 TRINITY_DN50292_c0_g1~~TRINITY_DN50292_c0_g1_i1.p1  ORF type:complete len:440 (+),score=57.79 TRINITY_DN50292_c0_g1_i1:114-1433(+)